MTVLSKVIDTLTVIFYIYLKSQSKESANEINFQFFDTVHFKLFSFHSICMQMKLEKVF